MGLSPVPIQKLEQWPLASRQTLHGPLGLEGGKEVRVPPSLPPPPATETLTQQAGRAWLL